MNERAPWVRVVMVCALAFFAACAEKKAAVRPAYDFSKIRRMTVMPFSGQGGPAASEEFIRQLVGTGIEVTDDRHPGDVLLNGVVTDYKANNQLMIFLGNTPIGNAGGQSVVVDNPVLSREGSQAMPEGTNLGTHHAQVVSIIATVGVNVQLLDASTKSVLWAGSMSYEALDLPGALHAAIAALNVSLARVVPAMTPKPS